MSKICQITGKKSVVGNNVSHSLRRTKRRFDVNLFTKKFYYVEEDCWIVLKRRFAYHQPHWSRRCSEAGCR